jgi:hypothetical protein
MDLTASLFWEALLVQRACLFHKVDSSTRRGRIQKPPELAQDVRGAGPRIEIAAIRPFQVRFAPTDNARKLPKASAAKTGSRRGGGKTY